MLHIWELTAGRHKPIDISAQTPNPNLDYRKLIRMILRPPSELKKFIQWMRA